MASQLVAGASSSRARNSTSSQSRARASASGLLQSSRDAVDSFTIIGDSSKKQIKLMLNHLEIFLRTRDLTVQQLEGDRDLVNEDFLTKFATWLGKDAIKLKKKAHPTDPDELISLSTAQHCLSQFKNWFLGTFKRDTLLPPCMSSDNWGAFMALVYSTKRASGAIGQKLVKQREKATVDDRKCLSACSIWSADKESAELFYFLHCGYQVAARGSEVATLKWESLQPFVRRDEDVNNDEQYRVIQMEVCRHKNSETTHQLAQIFPHRDSILLDYYFALAYYLTMAYDTGENMVPTFEAKVKRTNDGRVDASKVSALFSTLVKKLYKVMDGYEVDGDGSNVSVRTPCVFFFVTILYRLVFLRIHDITQENGDDLMTGDDDPYGLTRMNRKISSHSTRKATMNEFNDSDLSFMKWSFRVGFCLRNVHTMFDYVMDASTSVDANNGKVLAGWLKHSMTHHTSYMGGHPATLDVLHDGAAAKKCAEQLWSTHIRNGLDKQIAHMLFAHVLVKTNEFVELLEQEPKGKYSGTSTPYCHPFLRKLHQTFEDMDITPEKVNEWTDVVTKWYLMANQKGLPKHKPVETAEHRDLQQQMDHLSELQYQTSTEVHHMLLEQVSIRKIFQKLLVEQEKTNNLLQQITASANTASPYSVSPKPMRKSNENVGRPNADAVRPKAVDSLMWGDFIAQFNDPQVSLSNKFVLYHTHNFEAYFKSRSDKGVKLDRQHKYNLKLLVSTMVSLLPNPPAERPTDNEEAQQWRLELASLGKTAEDALLQKLGIVNDHDRQPSLTELIKKITLIRKESKGINTNEDLNNDENKGNDAPLDEQQHDTSVDEGTGLEIVPRQTSTTLSSTSTRKNNGETPAVTEKGKKRKTSQNGGKGKLPRTVEKEVHPAIDE